MILRCGVGSTCNSVVIQYMSIETIARLQQTLHKPQSTWDVALLSMPTEALGAWQRTPAGDGGIGRVLAPVSRGRAGGAGEGGRPTGGSRHHPSGLLVRYAALLSNAAFGGLAKLAKCSKHGLTLGDPLRL